MIINKTILVCGGAGFIGSNFIRFIFNKYRGNIRVVNFDKLTYSGNLNNLIDIAENKRLDYRLIAGDVAERKDLERTIKKFNPNYIINFAAETHVDRSVHTGVKEFVDTNIYGVFNILELVKKYGVEKYLQVSTDEVYGSLELNSKKKFTERTLLDPSSPYSSTKTAGDLLCMAYYKSFGIPVVLSRCSNNYGPYQYPEKMIPFWFYKLSQGEKIPIYGDGKNIRDWIHVDDHCEVLELILTKGRIGEVYNIGADNEQSNLSVAISLIEIYKRLHSKGHLPNKTFYEFVDDRPGHDRRYAIDHAKLTKEFDWGPKFGAKEFRQKLEETIMWYEKNNQWIEDTRAKTEKFNPHIK